MSTPYRRIVCCIDHDGMEDALVDEAVRLADGHPGVVHVVHVLAPSPVIAAGPYAPVHPPAETREGAERWLADVVARHPDVASHRVLDGDPVGAVRDWASVRGADLLVAAARRGLLERTILGGFASRIAYTAPCPVLLVHPSPAPARRAAATR
jgi:nucleotide-binding universal stress UspA family protein